MNSVKIFFISVIITFTIFTILGIIVNLIFPDYSYNTIISGAIGCAIGSGIICAINEFRKVGVK